MYTPTRVADMRATASEAGTDSHYDYAVNTAQDGVSASPAGAVTHDDDHYPDIGDALIVALALLFAALLWSVGY